MANASGKRPASGGSSSGGNHDLSHHHQPVPAEKRPRPSFVSAVVKALEHSQREKLWSAMEPVIRKVVSEEVERRLVDATAASRCLRRSPSLRVHALEPPPPLVNTPLHLVFPKTLKTPVYTTNKIVFDDGSPVQVLLTDPTADPGVAATGGSLMAVPFPIKVEIVALHGDFHVDGVWTAEEFEGSIVRAREGRRPLLVGELLATLRPDGGSEEPVATASFGNLQITDNSSWVPRGMFRLGARVVPESYGGAIRIHEAVSEAFDVRERRGEYYEKHYPPKLEDEVWRLEKIGKGGPRHRNLDSAGIRTVQDFLKMHTVHPQGLRSILGSEKDWEASLKHAKTCDIGSKLYLFQAHQHGPSLFLDPICRVVGTNIDGHVFTAVELTSQVPKAYMDELVKAAYSNWDTVQEIDEASAASTCALHP